MPDQLLAPEMLPGVNVLGCLPWRPSVALTHMLVDSLNDLLTKGFLKLPQWELSVESWPHNISLELSFGVISPDQLPSIQLDLANLELG